ncbi:hypothetical protein OIO90_001172 [Microbotryomycetes sp. JL221]|nr:hypothetical protein OIO90_001172 [Microbotryomycetes sp. JL221]
MTSLTSRVQLNDGNSIPQFGLGVYESEPGQETYNAVLWALEAGYRHIDGAEWYENEESCGRAIRDFIQKTGTPRQDIFFTTKLMHNQKDPQGVIDAINVSLQKSGLDYVDLYLIHGPEGGPEVRSATWQGCCLAKDAGKAKSIGVSNFGVKHLQDLLATKPKYTPTINQIDLHPFMTRDKLVEFCQQHDIVLEAWGPLVRGQRFDHPEVVRLANKYNRTPAQILLRWGLDRGFVVIPKSVKKQRIIDNTQVFDFKLEKDDLDQLTSLDEFLITDWEVSTVP